MKLFVYESQESHRIIAHVEFDNPIIVELAENGNIANCYPDEQGEIVVVDIWLDVYKTGKIISPCGYLIQ